MVCCVVKRADGGLEAKRGTGGWWGGGGQAPVATGGPLRLPQHGVEKQGPKQPSLNGGAPGGGAAVAFFSDRVTVGPTKRPSSRVGATAVTDFLFLFLSFSFSTTPPPTFSQVRRLPHLFLYTHSCTHPPRARYPLSKKKRLSTYQMRATAFALVALVAFASASTAMAEAAVQPIGHLPAAAGPSTALKGEGVEEREREEDRGGCCRWRAKRPHDNSGPALGLLYATLSLCCPPRPLV